MSSESFFPPTPEVQHLPTLFRRIQLGEIRVPAFQRGFVWREAQILQLLESVYRGFPIGSLLFWNVREKLLRIERSVDVPFPDVAETYPFKFLLDGLQRLSTLYGVFHWPDPDLPGRYNVVFDLDTEEFRHFEAGQLLGRLIRLSSLFSPKDFLATQRLLASETDSEELIGRAIRLHSVFQEYMVPTVTIENRSVPDVVAMFERINSTGTKLNAVDFMRAVTWSQDFDLNTEINSLSESLEGTDFEVPVETLVKALAVVSGTMPTPAAMLELRQLSAASLNQSMRTLRDAVEGARVFLERNLAIRSYEYLPYEGQFLVLLRFVQLGGTEDPQKADMLLRWLWATSFNEELRGKPDHYVSRTLDRLNELLLGNLQALQSRLALSVEDLLERRFIRGKALSAAFACMFAKRQARSLVTGEVVPSELYMRDFSNKNFDGAFDIPTLTNGFGRSFPSKKILANTFLFSEDDLLAAESTPATELLRRCHERHGDRAESILRSQFVPPKAMELLHDGDIVAFLIHRAMEMVRTAEETVACSTAER